MESLRECPFCGGIAGYVAPIYGETATYEMRCHRVMCSKCGTTKTGHNKESAIVAWNTRFPYEYAQWISVDSEFPKKERVLVLATTGRIMVAEYFGGSDWLVESVGMEAIVYSNITHWQLLPSPPTPKDVTNDD